MQLHKPNWYTVDSLMVLEMIADHFYYPTVEQS